MKSRYLYRYFFKNALHSFLFWLVIFVIGIEFLLPFLFKIELMVELSQSGRAKMIEKMLLEQLNLNLYILGFFLSPALGIIAGRALVNKEIEMLLAGRFSRRELYSGGFIFYGGFLFLVWLIFVGLYLLVVYIFKGPITLELSFKLIISIFGIMLPFFWVGFFSINTRPVVVILLYLIIYLSLPSIISGLDQPQASSWEKAVGFSLKTISIIVPQSQPFQLIASPFSRLGVSAYNFMALKLFGYGLVWSLFLLLSGFLIYQRRDMTDPHS